MEDWMSEKEFKAKVQFLIDENKLLGKYLKDLLVVIHQDGGQYTEEHGIEKSVRDATYIFYTKLN